MSSNVMHAFFVFCQTFGIVAGVFLEIYVVGCLALITFNWYQSTYNFGYFFIKVSYINKSGDIVVL